MELKEPRRKKHYINQPSLPLPIIRTSQNTIYKFSGHFNGFSVIVIEQDEMMKLNNMGCFGKANLSRGHPVFNPRDDEAQIIRKRIFNRRKEWGTKYSEKKKEVRKVIVVPNSENENEDYFTNIKPEYELDSSRLKEVLHLALEEAFFLLDCVQCLNIYNCNELLTQESAWHLFRETDKYFIQNYPVYFHFRSKKWVVKSGIKFGGDFLLYKDGPPFYHASYLVIIDILDSKTLQRRNDLCRRSMETKNLFGLNRLCETVGKDLLICQLLWPAELTTIEPQHLRQLSINETIMRRWVPSQNRELPETP